MANSVDSGEMAHYMWLFMRSNYLPDKNNLHVEKYIKINKFRPVAAKLLSKNGQIYTYCINL